MSSGGEVGVVFESLVGGVEKRKEPHNSVTDYGTLLRDPHHDLDKVAVVDL
jgi:hypothetical protein